MVQRYTTARLGASHGKTEAWIVLDIRSGHEGADAWIGLRDTVSTTTFQGWIDTQDVDAILGSLNHVQLRRGDVAYVPGGVPHAMAGGTPFAEL